MDKKDIAIMKKAFKAKTDTIRAVSVAHVTKDDGVDTFEYHAHAAAMDPDVLENCIGMLRKTVSGKEGRSMFELKEKSGSSLAGEFVENALRNPGEETDRALAVHIAGNYFEECDCVILIAHGEEDLFTAKKVKADEEESSAVAYRFVSAAILPVKAGKKGISYDSRNGVVNRPVTMDISAPVVGFVFPAVEEGAPDVGRAVWYAAKDVNRDLMDSLFSAETPQDAKGGLAVFRDMLDTAFPEGCSFDTAKSITEVLNDRKARGEEMLTGSDIVSVIDDAACEEIHDRDKLKETAGSANASVRIEDVAPGKTTLHTQFGDLVVDTKSLGGIRRQTVDGQEFYLIPAAISSLNSMVIAAEKRKGS